MSKTKQEAKAEAKERDGYECQFCGVTNEEHEKEYGRGLDAHHVVKAGDNGADEPKNLITVCRSCHKTLETTQADALSRIRDEHTARYERKIDNLERKIQSQTKLISAYREFAEWLFNKRFGTQVHVVSEGLISPPTIEVITSDNQESLSEYNMGEEATLCSSRVSIPNFVELISNEDDEPEEWDTVIKDLEEEQITDRVIGEAQE